MDYNDKKLLIAIVAQELADIDPSTLAFGEYDSTILPNAVRKLAYWLNQDVTHRHLDDAQEALCDLARCADGTDLAFEGLGGPDTPENRQFWREYFDFEYETAVINIIGPAPKKYWTGCLAGC